MPATGPLPKIVPPVFAGGESAQSSINQHRSTRTRSDPKKKRTVPCSSKRVWVSSTMLGDVQSSDWKFETASSPMRGLTLGNTSVNEVIASTRHFRHSDGRHRVSCVLVYCFYIFPGYLGVACGGSYRLRVSFRSIDLCLREVCL